MGTLSSDLFSMHYHNNIKLYHKCAAEYSFKELVYYRTTSRQSQSVNYTGKKKPYKNDSNALRVSTGGQL